MSETGFVVQVPEAESRVRSLRERFDPVARAGVPAHITVLFPFMAPESVDESVLRLVRTAISGIEAFEFALTTVGRFPTTAYLAPQPAGPFVVLTESLARAFPAFPPFGGEFESVVPHLTVAHGNATDAEIAAFELSAAMAFQGPIHSVCNSLVLLENSSGQWRQMHVFPLGRGPGAG